MRKNPVIPYAMIALIGILTVVVISFIGLNQREEIQQAEEGGDEQTEESQEGETTDDPAAIYEANCAACHGADLSGGAGPELAEVGNRLSEDEIKEIIINGTDGGMPGGLVNEEQSGAIATWLSEQ